MHKKKRKLPTNRKEIIHIVVEGYTDSAFLTRILKELNTSKKYNIKIHDSKGGDNIPKVYQRLKKTNSLQKVIVLFDLDNKDTLATIKSKFKNRVNIDSSNIFFVNPVIELLFILSKTFKLPKHTTKSNFKTDLKNLYGVNNYSATEEQVNTICSSLNKNDYIMLYNNLRNPLVSKIDTNLPSTNIKEMIDSMIDK